MLEILPDLEIPEAALTFTFSRSSGPGGQNVNKTASRVTVRLDVRGGEYFNEAQRARLEEKLAHRINKAGELVIHADETREQLRNRELAVRRLVTILRRALREPRPRKKTKRTKASIERRLDAKKKRGDVKRDRQAPDAEP